MAHFPDNLLYTIQHEWVLIEGPIAVVGITDFAQEQLGDVVFVDLPEMGRQVRAEEACGAIESIKSVSDLYTPVSGEVVEINSALEETPERLNSDCYQNWIVKIKMSDPSEIEELLDCQSYRGQLPLEEK